MQATVTLSSTTFATTVLMTDTQVNLTSTSGIVPGICLFANRELMVVDRLTGIGNWAVVRRGQDGTRQRPHSTDETVYIARADQLYDMDPQGVPIVPHLVNPHINVQNGLVWVIQGDDVGPGSSSHTWQLVTTTQTIGALGVRVTTVTTPS